MDVLVDMTSEDLQTIGVTAFGHRHKILKKAKEVTPSLKDSSSRYGLL